MNGRRIASLFLLAAGAGILLSSALINPWAAPFYRAQAVHYNDAMLGYFAWSLALGILIVLLGAGVWKCRRNFIDNLAVLVFTLSLFVLSDRLILAKIGLPLWIPDADIHYRHRPGATRVWPDPPRKVIRINAYGHHDDDFPETKPPGEFRALMIGDSITMGHGLEAAETFSNQLEEMLARHAEPGQEFQIINAAVQGYSTFQELHVFKESLCFHPDLVVVGFCMNDVVEPFVVNRKFGGTGFDYHEVVQIQNPLISFLFNETGYGRLLQRMRSKALSRETEVKKEIFNVRTLAAHSGDDPKLREAWRIVWNDLDRIYALARENKIRPLLLIFPYTFQLFDPDLQAPQEMLKANATESGVDFIDLTKVFSDRIRKEVEEYSRNEKPTRPLRADLPPAKHFTEMYFLDSNHLTAEGHRVVAQQIFDYLEQKRIVRKASESIK